MSNGKGDYQRRGRGIKRALVQESKKHSEIKIWGGHLLKHHLLMHKPRGLSGFILRGIIFIHVHPCSELIFRCWYDGACHVTPC